MKKALMILFFLILLIGITSCTTYEEVVPHPDDYAVWDGNYIYRGLYRCKTTGESESLLIKNIEYNGETYYFDVDDYYYTHSGKYLYYNNDIYYVFNTKKNKDLNETDSCFIVKYSTKDQNYIILYANTLESLSLKINKVNEKNIFLLSGDSNSLNDLYVLDIMTHELSLFEDLGRIHFSSNDILIKNNKAVYHMDPITLNMTKVYELNNSTVSFVEYDKFIRFDIVSSVDDEKRYLVGYFVKETKEFKMIVGIDNTKEISFIDESHFILFETKPFTYKASLKKDITEYLKVNNVLCNISFDTFTYDEIYEFENQNSSYLNGKIIDGYYYVVERYIKKGWFIFEGGRESKAVKLNLLTKRISKDRENIANKNEIKTKSLEYGNFIYYFETKSFGPILGSYDAVYFYRKHVNKEQPQLMQFFVFSGDHVVDNYEGTRSASYVWMYTLDLNEDYFMILDY